MSEESKDPEAIIECHYYNALPRESLAVKKFLAARNHTETAAVNVNHYRQRVPRSHCRSPHIRIKAIFADGFEAGVVNGIMRALRLHTRWRILLRFSNTVPRNDGFWGTPPQAANGRRSVRNAFVYLDCWVAA